MCAEGGARCAGLGRRTHGRRRRVTRGVQEEARAGGSRRRAVAGVVAALVGCARWGVISGGTAAAHASEGGEGGRGAEEEEEEAAARVWFNRNGASFVIPSMSAEEYARVIAGVGPRAFGAYMDQIRDAETNPVRYNACAEALLVGDLDSVLQSVFYLPYALASEGQRHVRALAALAAADEVEAAREPLVRGLRAASRSVGGPSAEEQRRLLGLAADMGDACARVAHAAL